MRDITKYIGKDSDTEKLTDFYADFEDYTTGIKEIDDIESGDMVGWVWDNKRYFGIIRDSGSGKDALFDLRDVKILE